MDELFTAFLSETLNLKNEEVAALLFKKADDNTLTTERREDAIAALKAADAARMAKFDTKTHFNNGYASGKEKALTILEKKLRDKYGPEFQGQGEELVDAIIESQKAQSGKPLGDDAVKSHPLYVGLEKKFVADLNAKDEEHRQKMSEFETGYRTRETRVLAREKARGILLAMNPNLPALQTVADKQVSAFLAEFDAYVFEPQADGDFLVKNLDGTRVENEHRHAVPFADMVRATAGNWFEFAAQSPKGPPGTPTQKPNTPAAPGVKLPATDADFALQYAALGADAAAKKQLLDAWKAKHPAT